MFLALLWLFGCERDPVDSDPCAVSAPVDPVEVLYGPYAMIQGDRVVLRFQTRTDVVVPVTVDGCAVPVTRTVRGRTFRWPDVENAMDVADADLPGEYAWHEATLAAPAPGERVEWAVHAGSDAVLRGSTRTPPGPGSAFTFAFVGDTMMPFNEAVFAAIGAASPDVFLHGGDIQYQPNPADTWQGYFRRSAPVSAVALHQAAPGNHEYEGQEEFTVMYAALFGGQGNAGPGPGSFYYDYAGVRFIALDTEQPLVAESAQLAWLDATLAEVGTSDSLDRAIVYFHRPIYTLSRHEPRADLREALHPLFRQHGVKLVLQGHNHVYERFLSDGITYVVDGGGGAFLYGLGEHDEDLPEDAALRQDQERAYGFTLANVGSDGVIAVERRNDDGAVVDAFEVR